MEQSQAIPSPQTDMHTSVGPFPLVPDQWHRKESSILLPRGMGLPFARPIILQEYIPSDGSPFAPTGPTSPYGFHFRRKPLMGGVVSFGPYDPATQLMMGGILGPTTVDDKPSASTYIEICKYYYRTEPAGTSDSSYKEDCYAD